MRSPVAILSSDWHLRTTVPASRKERCWYKVMEARMLQIRELQGRLGGVPIVVSGDLFDRPDPPASLVSWAMEHLPYGILAIPGQHDLSGHLYENRNNGAYGALVKAGKITDLQAEAWKVYSPHPSCETTFAVYSMPWGKYSLPEPANPDFHYPKIISLHKYVWATDNSRYSGADDSSRVTSISGLADLADVVSIGDNHTSWRVGKFLNHGSLFSTTSAQQDHAHHLGILYDDKTFEFVRFPEASVEWVDRSPGRTVSPLIRELQNLDVENADFRAQVSVAAEKLDENGKKAYIRMSKTVFGR